MLIEIPPEFFDVRYDGKQTPGMESGLANGANCQHFCYEFLRYFGFKIGNLRSSDLWEDEAFTYAALDLQQFDLILFSKDSNSYGAHVGIYIGGNKILHLSKKNGKPVVWALDQFKHLAEYAHIIGIKRPKLTPVPSLASDL